MQTELLNYNEQKLNKCTCIFTTVIFTVIGFGLGFLSHMSMENCNDSSLSN
jgi:hypothetical protein